MGQAEGGAAVSGRSEGWWSARGERTRRRTLEVLQTDQSGRWDERPSWRGRAQAGERASRTYEVLGKVGDTSLVVVARTDVKVDADGRRLGVGLELLWEGGTPASQRSEIPRRARSTVHSDAIVREPSHTAARSGSTQIQRRSEGRQLAESVVEAGRRGRGGVREGEVRQARGTHRGDDEAGRERRDLGDGLDGRRRDGRGEAAEASLRWGAAGARCRGRVRAGVSPSSSACLESARPRARKRKAREVRSFSLARLDRAPGSARKEAGRGRTVRAGALSWRASILEAILNEGECGGGEREDEGRVGRTGARRGEAGGWRRKPTPRLAPASCARLRAGPPSSRRARMTTCSRLALPPSASCRPDSRRRRELSLYCLQGGRRGRAAGASVLVKPPAGLPQPERSRDNTRRRRQPSQNAADGPLPGPLARVAPVERVQRRHPMVWLLRREISVRAGGSLPDIGLCARPTTEGASVERLQVA